jgi:hypothetical protein
MQDFGFNHQHHKEIPKVLTDSKSHIQKAEKIPTLDVFTLSGL